MHLLFLFSKGIQFENQQTFIRCLLLARYFSQCYFHLILRNVKLWSSNTENKNWGIGIKFYISKWLNLIKWKTGLLKQVQKTIQEISYKTKAWGHSSWTPELHRPWQTPGREEGGWEASISSKSKLHTLILVFFLKVFKKSPPSPAPRRRRLAGAGWAQCGVPGYPPQACAQVPLFSTASVSLHVLDCAGEGCTPNHDRQVGQGQPRRPWDQWACWSQRGWGAEAGAGRGASPRPEPRLIRGGSGICYCVVSCFLFLFHFLHDLRKLPTKDFVFWVKR